MTVTKILEQTLSAGATSVSFTDTDIPNSLIRVYSSNYDLIPVSRILSGNTLTVTYEAQASNIDVAVEIVKAGLDIVDALNSTDTDKALSANQGKTLKDAVDTLTNTVNNLDIPDSITDLDDVNVTSIQDGQVLAWDNVSQKFVNVNQSGGGSSINYSETEQKIGTWVDGSDLFMKTINFGALPNSSQKTVVHSISNLNAFIEISGVASGATNRFPLPYIDTNQLSYGIGIYADATNITIRTGSDRSSYNAYVTLKYTKTS